MRMHNRLLFLGSSLFLITCLAASVAQATPSLLIDVPGGSPAQDLFDDGTCTGNVDCQGAGVQFWTLDGTPTDIFDDGNLVGRIDNWNASFQDGTDGGDPFVSTGITIRNNSGQNQQYIVEVLLPLAVGTSYNNNFGSLGLSLTDSNGAMTTQGNWAFLDQFDGFVYRGNVDGTPELERNFVPSPVTVTSQGGSTDDNEQFPPPNAAGPGVANNISIRLAFELSAGDSAAIQASYGIVPEPGTGLLMGLGLTALAIARRRSR